MIKFEFKPGDIVRDVISGFVGVVFYRTGWLYNCNTYGLKEKDPKEKRPGELYQFDEPQLELMDKEIIEEDNGTGGPVNDIIQTNRQT